MNKFLSQAVLFCCVFLVAFRVYGVGEKYSAPNSISPVYEEMLAHQVFVRWKESVQKDKPKPAPFFVVGWGEKENVLANGVAASLKRYHREAADWQYMPFRDWEKNRNRASFNGVILIGLDTAKNKGLRNAASYIGRPENKGFLIVFATEPIGRVWLESIFEKADLEIQAIISLPELEFVKDEKGRQVVDLDLPNYRNMIYEQLVREGMNPVNAFPAADQAIQSFRKSRASKILIAGDERRKILN